MPSLTCPRCHAEVTHEEGEQPICPACGLGAREQDLAEHAEAPHHYPDAADPIQLAGAGGTGGWKVPTMVAAGLVGAALVVWLIVAAVGGGGPSALSQEEAEQTAALAMEDFATDLEAPDGGDLRSVRGEFTFDDTDLGGSGSFTMESEWGLGDTGHFLFDVSVGGGFSFRFAMEAYCSPERDVLVLDGTAYEARPDPDASCMDLLTGDDADDGGDGGDGSGADAGMDGLDEGLLLPEEFRDNMTVTPHGDGTVTAAFHDADGNYTLEVDAQGRARSLTVDSPEGSGSFDIDYGARRTIDLPDTEARFPSSVGGYCFFFEKTCTMDLHDGDDAPLDEFELRVYAADAEVGVDAPEETFPLFVGNASRNGFTFLIHEDGDGLLGDGDTLTVKARSNDYKLVVWDTWADRDVDDVPVPAPGAAWLLAALGVAALALRRRA